MNWRVHPSRTAGTVEVPGDKSIAHRALMVAALAGGVSRIDNVPSGEDVLSTMRCLRGLGIRIDVHGAAAEVRSPGVLSPPHGPLDAGNSGTTIRLLAGILAAQPFHSSLTGDASLCRRPMGRIIGPLVQMGGHVTGTDGRAPLHIEGRPLTGIRYEMPVASAQVKSCLLFAGLHAQGETVVVEREHTRDHTERLFEACGISVGRDGYAVSVRGGQKPAPLRLTVPGDVSTAAFFFTAAALSGGPLTVRACGVNPTRMGLPRVLREMGMSVECLGERLETGEPVADVRVAGPPHHPVHVTDRDVPELIDEIPLLALIATQVEGTSTIRGASELRLKECDRIHAVTESLTSMGARIDEQEDGFVIHGPTPLHGAETHSYGDHRIAMMLAVAGTIAQGQTIIRDADAAAVSFPGFKHAFQRIGAALDAA